MPCKDFGRASLVVAAATIASLAVLTASCGGVDRAAGSGSGTGAASATKIDLADFSTTIDNPYLPLAPGTRMVYEGSTADGQQRTVVS